jgi:hypothetical protein
MFKALPKDYQVKVAKKWGAVLESGPANITTNHKKLATAVVLENTQEEIQRGRKRMMEAFDFGSVDAGIPGASATQVFGDGDSRIPSIVIPTTRRIFPELLAHEVVGVQPMNGPAGFAFALRFYDNSGNELGYNRIDPAYSGATDLIGEDSNPADGTFDAGVGSLAGTETSYWAAFNGSNNSSGQALPMATAEGLKLEDCCGPGTMGTARFAFEKKVVEAKERKLGASWPLELAEDMKNMHGVDAEGEMTEIISYEIQAEIDRELLKEMVGAAIKGGRTSTWDPTKADGRNQLERIGTLYTHVLDKAQDIAIATRRGSANWAITSPKITALIERIRDFAFDDHGSSKVDASKVGVAQVGTLRSGGIKLYRDTFAAGNYVLLGFKGNNPYDSGVIYCPYIPVSIAKAVDPYDFSPRMGVRTRYGLLDNLFGADLYYQFIKIDNIAGTSVADGSRQFTF